MGGGGRGEERGGGERGEEREERERRGEGRKRYSYCVMHIEDLLMLNGRF